MASTYSNSLRFELPGIGEQANTWGSTLNSFMGTLLEQAISGYQVVSMPDSNYTLTTSNGSTDQARSAVIELTGTLSLDRDVIAPLKPKLYFIYNNTTRQITIRAATGSGVQIPSAARRIVYCNGTTGFFDAVNDLPTGTLIGGQTVVTTTGSQTLTNKTLTSPRVGTAILDTNGNEVVALTSTASAVNEVSIANSAAGNAVTIGAAGADANININLTPKGTGSVTWNGVQLVTSTGSQTLTNKTLTTPIIGTAILDTNGNELVSFTTAASAIHEVNIRNAAAGNIPTISVTSSDADVNLNLTGKGVGTVLVNSIPIVTTTAAQTLTNKTLTAPVMTVPQFSSIVNTGTITLPTSTDTLVGRATTDTLTNKTLTSPIINTPSIVVRDNVFTIQDNLDASKQTVFELSAISPGATRTVTFPDSDIVVNSKPFNAQTGTTYTVASSDRSDIITFNSASAVAVTLPVFANGFYFLAKNIGTANVTITPASGTIVGGTSLVLPPAQWAIILSDGTNHNAMHTGFVNGALSSRDIGYRGLPQNSQNGASYTLAAGDEGGMITHSGATALTITIPSNATVPFPVGTVVAIVNEPGAANITVSITSDTLNRGDGSAGTGSRTIGPNSFASIIKTTATSWMITGSFS